MASDYGFAGFAWYGPKVMADIKKSASRGTEAAAIFLVNALKKTLSIPAPRIAVVGVRGVRKGIRYYRATTRATPGAPPRKLSGDMRGSITYRMSGEKAWVGTNLTPYPEVHEKGDHPWFRKTAELVRKELGAIIGKTVKIG